jgi:hypothetical protein
VGDLVGAIPVEPLLGVAFEEAVGRRVETGQRSIRREPPDFQQLGARRKIGTCGQPAGVCLATENLHTEQREIQFN